ELREGFELFLQRRWFMALPVFLRCQAIARPVGATAVVRAAESTGAVPGGCNQLRYAQTSGERARFQVGNFGITEGVIHCWNRVLPNQIFRWYIWPQVAAFGP